MILQLCQRIAKILEKVCEAIAYVHATSIVVQEESPVEALITYVVDLINPQVSYGITLDLTVTFPWKTYTRSQLLKYKSTSGKLCDNCGYSNIVSYTSYGPVILLSPPVVYVDLMFDNYFRYYYYMPMMKVEFTCINRISYVTSVPYKMMRGLSRALVKGYISRVSLQNFGLRASSVDPSKPHCWNYHIRLWGWGHEDIIYDGHHSACTF